MTKLRCKEIIFTCLFLLIPVFCRKHHLRLENDMRKSIPISTFGFLKGGFLSVEIHQFDVQSPPNNKFENVGFTIDRTLNDGLNPYSQNIERSYCPLDLKEEGDNVQRLSRIALTFDVQKSRLNIQCKNLEKLSIFQNSSSLPYPLSSLKKTMIGGNIMANQRRRKRSPQGIDPEDMPEPSLSPLRINVPRLSSVAPLVNKPPQEALRNDAGSQALENNDVPKEDISKQSVSVAKPSSVPIKKSTVSPLDEHPDYMVPDQSGSIFEDPAGDHIAQGQGCTNVYLPLKKSNNSNTGLITFSTSFTIYIGSEEMEGLYMLYFHNCFGEESLIDLNMSIIEQNQGRNFLSAGEMPLPALYFMMSIIFFISGCFWVFILQKSKKESGVAVFKIHYLMGVLVFLKSLSLLFHAINYHYIQTEGTHVETFAVLYYSFHLLKGALLFVTILLIGTGYAFVKHLLSDKDKKIFMIVIPLQILANVAEIIMEESEEAEIVHTTWKVIFISVDLLCCGAILFPVVWSIKHLQEASRTDGKAATNLRKLKLFRHFYIIVVCYIYFTRIIVKLLLKITIPFQYEWVVEMFLELTTFIFFVLTGYKFRPAANNPYLSLAHDSDDETDVALTESGLTAGVSKRSGRGKKKTLKEIVLFDPNDDTDDDEEVLLEKHRDRESDHFDIRVT